MNDMQIPVGIGESWEQCFDASPEKKTPRKSHKKCPVSMDTGHFQQRWPTARDGR
ncbi:MULTISPECIES: hypothetical protein [Pseudomonas]|uniref:hypothetical protein n=1 Tax=Pseudomonas TaxID=286 RepID=UPI0012EE181A|nr:MULTISPECIES: hypothetical protein [Pseudomonas]